jgi:hypothetical protein
LYFILDKKIKIVDIAYGMHDLIVINIREETEGFQAAAPK